MPDAVLVVQRTKCGEYKTIAAQLPPEELNAVAAAALSALVDSGADVVGVLDAMKRVETKSVERNVLKPILLTGGKG